MVSTSRASGSVFASLLRVKQWTKNLFLFAGVVFARQALDPSRLGRAGLAFVSFCLLSSALYILNDLVDLEADRRHPKKKYRPLAAGVVRTETAVALAGGLFVGGLAVAVALGWAFAGLAVFYLLLTLAYTLFFKRIVLIDIMVLALGFVLRAVAGAVAVEVSISPWLLVCTMSLALFLALIKRRQEIKGHGAESRVVLASYPLAFLDQAILIVTATTLMGYILYTFTSSQSKRLMWTIPFVFYGLFRYLLLMELKGSGEEPEEILFTDRPFLVNLFLWGLGCLLVLYWWE